VVFFKASLCPDEGVLGTGGVGGAGAIPDEDVWERWCCVAGITPDEVL